MKQKSDSTDSIEVLGRPFSSFRKHKSSSRPSYAVTPYLVVAVLLLLLLLFAWREKIFTGGDDVTNPPNYDYLDADSDEDKPGMLSPSQCSQQQCPGKIVRDYNYQVTSHSDINGEDLMHVQARDLDTVKKVCDMFDECAGFNSNGWLKSKVSIRVAGPADLYIKGEAIVSLSERSAADTSYASTSFSNDYNQMLKTMKIYIYDTTIGLKHRTIRSGGYGVERMLIEQLMRSQFRTRNPEEATFFFLPIRCSAYVLGFSTEEQGKQHAREYIGDMVNEVQTKYPYWRRSNGADHFYVCAHDIGAEVGRDLLKNSIAMVNTADYEDPYFIPHKDISLPPNPMHGLNSPPSDGRGGASISPKTRTTLAFFAGDVTSGRIRPALWKHFAFDPDFTIIRQAVAWKSYLNYLKQAKFCLIPRGREVWTPRLMDAVFYGCIPVILSDHYQLPLQGLVDWTRFSVIVPESQVFRLKSILTEISEKAVGDMQKHLADVYSHFVWNSPSKPFDAFYSVMYQLWQRRHIIKYKAR